MPLVNEIDIRQSVDEMGSGKWWNLLYVIGALAILGLWCLVVLMFKKQNVSQSNRPQSQKKHFNRLRLQKSSQRIKRSYSNNAGTKRARTERDSPSLRLQPFPPSHCWAVSMYAR